MSRRGRRRDYCTKLCQGRAQRQRDRERRAGQSAGHAHHAVATELGIQAEELLALVHSEAPLASVLELTAQVQGNAVRLTVALAAVARAGGATWDEVAAAAGISSASARARWGGPKAARLVAGASPTAVHRPRSAIYWTAPIANNGFLPAAPAVRERARMLGSALKVLQQRSPLSIEQLARMADVPLAAVYMALDGQAVAPWPTTYTLADLLGGEPGELRWLWERAWHGSVRLSPADEFGALSTVLRGARLGAGAPALPAISEQAGLAFEETAAIFDGGVEPDWPTLCRLVNCFGVSPEELRTLRVSEQRRIPFGAEG